MAVLFQLALAPVLILLIYFYIRDKYEKEPIRLLLIGVVFGAVSSGVILGLGAVAKKFAPQTDGVFSMLYSAFIASAMIEEGVKYIFLYFLCWKNKNFNERFDGIVYAVFISLGFAAVENVIYVFHAELGGFETALSRAVFSVPGHALFAVFMGYYFAIARFEPDKEKTFLSLAFVIPLIMHACFNLILLLSMESYIFFLLPYVIYMCKTGLEKMKMHLARSPFKK